MKKLIFSLAMLGFLLIALAAKAQSQEELLAQLLEEEQGSIEALALYPEDTRTAILEASKYPEALIKLESVQSKTSESFRNLMESYPKETQKMIWDLTRYPGLVAILANNPGKDPQNLLDEYPAVIHQRALDAYYKYPNLLSEIDYLNREWDLTFNKLIDKYPLSMQDAFRELVDLPEVLTILTENIRMTILVGDLYRHHPIWLLQQMDSLNLAIAREKAKETADWKQSLENDTQARNEFTASATAFANEYGYDDDYYAYDDDTYGYYSEDRAEVVEHYYYHHYPYWFGYPSWYMYPRWRPYPYWYDWGFYWGPSHVIIVIDLPSFYFTNWYFYYPQHHHHYPHFSSHLVNHYYGHRTSSNSVTVGVENWRNRNREVVSNEWLESSRNRPEGFSEFGHFEEARQKYNRSHADKPLTQREYLDKNQKKYKTLTSNVLSEKPAVREERSRTAPSVKKETEPSVRPPEKQEQTRKTEPSEKPKTDIPLPKTEPRQKTEPKAIPKVDKGSEHHRNTWEKSKPKVERNETAPARPKTTAPKTSTPKKSPAPKPNSNKKGNRQVG